MDTIKDPKYIDEIHEIAESKKIELDEEIDREKILELFKGIELFAAGAGYRDYWPPCHEAV